MNALTYTAAIHSGRVQLVSLRQKSLTVARLRVLLVAAVFVAMAMAAIVRIGFLGVTGSGRAVTSFEDALLPSRGEITDRNGEPLARAFPAFALWYNPEALGEDNPLVRSPQAVAKELAAIFPDIDETELADRLAKGKAGYLRRRVLPEEANKVQAIGELALELPKETDRHYPQGSLGAHVLGYVGADGHGRVGMEAVLDKQLLDPATRGQPIPLSIDVRVQGALEDELTRRAQTWTPGLKVGEVRDAISPAIQSAARPADAARLLELPPEQFLQEWQRAFGWRAGRAQQPEPVADAAGRWDRQRANEWQKGVPWLAGFNYLPRLDPRTKL